MTLELAALTPVTFAEETAIDVQAPEAAVPRFELGLAPRSEHNLYETFDGIEGVFVATWETLELGREVELTICLPGGQSIDVQGEVTFAREASRDASPGVGVRFQGLDEVDHRTLEVFAELREPLFHC